MRNAIDPCLLQWEEGCLDDNDLSALTRLLADDADARRLFREYRQMSESFRRVLSSANTMSAGKARTVGRRVWPGALPWAIAASLTLALGAWLALPRLRQAFSAAPPFATVAETTGPAWSRSPDGTWSALKPGAVIAEGQRIVTDANARLVLSLRADQTEIVLAESSVLSVPAREPSDVPIPRLRLEQGSLFAAVAPASSGRQLMAETPHTRLRVLGTRFALHVSGSVSDGKSPFTPYSTRLDVEEGIVETQRIGGQNWIPIRSGQGAVANANDSDLFVLGAIVFHDDFEKGLGQWTVQELPGNAPRAASELQPASPQTQKAVRVVPMERNGQTRAVLEINGMTVPDRTLYMLSHPSFSEQDIVSDISFILMEIGQENDLLNGWISPQTPVSVRELSAPEDRRIAIPKNRWVDRGATDMLRWSKTPEGNTRVRITRMTDGQRKGDYVWEYDAADNVFHRYFLAVQNVIVRIDHITVRELIAVH